LLACKFDSAQIDLTDFIRESKLLESKAVRAESVRFDDVRARLEIRAMNRGYELGIRQVEAVEAFVELHSSGVQHRA
jgi:hypothetical protein